ncbi:SLBB domain-containing protein [Gammaproteobacteria bacterium]|nr:SLBB domain-containing protein [Gammaproteobacteria bacterium]MDC0090052.1 SLBB domain-containing protein [Gammaproteobacteria bacterium]
MKKFLINFICFYAFFLSNAVTSQELNEAFLQSLPKSIQEDFLSAGDDDDLTDNFNERPETRIRKVESGIDDIKNQIQSLESQINREDIKGGIIIFGSNFFDSYQTSFAPINQLNFSSDYVIDVGDVLSVQTFGKIKVNKKLIVSRDGSINIPNIGIISVAGLPYADAIESVQAFVSQKFFGLEVFINLDLARDMSILLVGDAAQPGIYTLPGGSNILSLLHAAGGINEGGSYRSIIHKRNNRIIQELDLYDVLIKGNLLFKSPLRSGDSVIISPSKRLVSISGGINTPAIYELKDNEQLEDLLNLAQGFSISATDEIFISDAKGNIAKVSREERALRELKHGDSIKIPLFSPITQSIFTVSIDGAVKKPGEYSFFAGTSLHEIIAKAGGYKDNAYPYGSSLFRKKVADIQQEAFDKTYASLINFLASNSNGTSVGMASSQNLQTILGELKASKFKGRVAAEFSQRKVEKDASLDTILSDGDEIFIPYFTSDVYVTGDILNPGGRRYSSELKPADYIEQSGGLGRFADRDRIIVIKPNGDAEVIKSQLFFSYSGTTIYPGSTIYVPRGIGKLEGIAFTATLAPIVSSLALSLASLNSIQD